MSIPTFFGLNIGLSGLEVAQQAESVVSNNISNANTTGYTVENTDVGEGFPYTLDVGTNSASQIGQGSAVEQVARQTNSFVNLQDRNNQGTQQMYQTHQQTLNQIQSILNEPSGNGMQNSLDQFFQSWQTLSANPSDTAARQAVISQAQQLGNTFHTVTTNLENLQSNLMGTVTGQVGELQDDANQVSKLNTQIVETEQAGENPNSLLDQRGVYLDKMSKLANISYSASSVTTNGKTYDGAVTVTLGSGANQVTLVSADPATNKPTDLTTLALLPASQSGLSTFKEPSGFNLSDITSGSIAGNVAGLDDTSKVLSKVNSFLTALSNEVNKVQQGNVPLKSTDTLSMPPIFDASTTPAGNVVLGVDSTLLGPDGTDYVGVATTANSPNDNTGAVKMVNLQNETNQSASTASFGSGDSTTSPYVQLQSGTAGSSTYDFSSTFDQNLTSVVSDVGVEASSVNSSVETANSLEQQSSNLRQSISGVDINQQAAQMVEWQSQYNAAAKFISVFNSMLNTLVTDL